MPRAETLIHVWNGSDRLTCDGVAVNLYRDNVEHLLQRDEPNESLAQLHSLADVAWGQRPAQLDPCRLRAELSVSWDRVWRVPVREMVMNEGTKALLRARLGACPRPSEVATWLQRQSPIGPSCNTLGELIANLVHELSALAARAKPNELLRCATPRMLVDPGTFSEARVAALGPSGPYRY